MKKINYLLVSLSLMAIASCATPQTQISPSANPSQSASANVSPTPASSSSVTPTTSPSVSTSPTSSPAQQVEIKSITSGASFGECIGYCNNKVEFNSGKAIISKVSNNDKEKYPDITKEASFTADEWSNLVKLVDSKKFNTLAESIGCPDCADGGAESITITTSTGTKKVTFEFGKDVPEVSALVTKLRELRNKYLDTVK